MDIEFSGKNYEVHQVIEHLKDQITPERWQKIQQVIQRRCDWLTVVLENIYDRGNASAVMRSMEAFGYYQLHHIQLQEEFKESQRVTQGADKWLLQKQWSSTSACIKALKDQGLKIYVTHLEGGRPLQEVDFSQPAALCFGNEKDGASEELCQLADERVFVPMYGFVQSFNISVAAALCLQSIRKIHDSLPVPSLSPEKQAYLQARYLLKSCKNPTPHLPTSVK